MKKVLLVFFAVLLSCWAFTQTLVFPDRAVKVGIEPGNTFTVLAAGEIDTFVYAGTYKELIKNADKTQALYTVPAADGVSYVKHQVFVDRLTHEVFYLRRTPGKGWRRVRITEQEMLSLD